MNVRSAGAARKARLTPCLFAACLLFAVLLAAASIPMHMAYAGTLSAADTDVENEPGSVYHLRLGSYYSIDITGDGIADVVTIQATKLPDLPNGITAGYERGSFRIIVNDKTVLTDNTGGFVNASAELITLKNKKTFINLLLGNFAIDSATVNALYQYQNGKLNRVYNFQNIAGNYSYQAEYGDAFGDYASVAYIEGNTVVFDAYNAKAMKWFQARFRYIGGTLKRIAAKDPGKPALLSAKSPATRKLTVKVGKAKRASGYQYKIARDKKFTKQVKAKTSKKTKVTFTHLKKGKRYYVKVRAYKKAYGQKAYGKWSKTKSVKVKR